MEFHDYRWYSLKYKLLRFLCDKFLDCEECSLAECYSQGFKSLRIDNKDG